MSTRLKVKGVRPRAGGSRSSVAGHGSLLLVSRCRTELSHRGIGYARLRCSARMRRAGWPAGRQADVEGAAQNYRDARRDLPVQGRRAWPSWRTTTRASRRPTRRWSEYQDLLGVDNVLIVVSRDGGVVAQRAGHAGGLRLRSASTSCAPCSITDDPLRGRGGRSCPSRTGVTMRYYAARIDDGSMAVVEQDPAELRQLVEDTGSTKSVLKNIAIGQHGFMLRRVGAGLLG